ncbi:MAG TPA: circadian clock protein KaiC [Telluria sp.]|nr:circadian clock protein KaiC [Telluria sp.]
MPTPDAASLKKTPTGMAGFDEITGGGLPQGRTSIIMGGPGSGKTVFALQTLINGAHVCGERGIFVAFEENSRSVIANAASFGWDLSDHEKLLFMDAGMAPDVVQTGRFDVGSLLAGIRTRFAENRATRIVFDSIDVLLALLDDPFTERHELYRIQDWLAANDVTGIITARSSTSGETYDFLEFMADCVIHLGQHVTGGVAHRDLRVAKYRGSCIHEGVFPLIIGTNGMEVASPIPREMHVPACTERVSTGIDRLDTMLRGGYFRGSTALVTGAPGTAKSTLAAAFAEASSRRGERCLYVSFDESSGEIIRNMTSIGLDLQPQVDSGNLRFHSVQSGSLNAEEHLIAIKALISEYQPRSLVMDPLSAVLKSATSQVIMDVPLRLINYTKSQGITMLSTSLVENSDSPESTEMNVSTIADTWIHLSFKVQMGERNRLLTIVKCRGTGHSRQARELVLSDEGVTLADVFVAGGEVLMGTLRWEKEEANRRAKALAHTGLLRKERELSLAEAEVRGRIDLLTRELELRRAENEALAEEIELEKAQRDISTSEIGRLRGADRPSATTSRGAPS